MGNTVHLGSGDGGTGSAGGGGEGGGDVPTIIAKTLSNFTFAI